MTFAELKITRQFLNAIEEKGYEEPTPIQIKAIPPIRSGQDVIGIAQTGTGKTAAFLLPLLMKVKYAQGETPRALVLLPTRELAMQVMENLEQYSKYTDLRSLCVVGGKGIKGQAAKIAEGVDIIVGTPGRLRDLYARNALEMKQIKTVVMDEVDRMLDMGFKNQIVDIVSNLPKKRQMLMFSATLSPKMEELCLDITNFPLKIEITPQATPVETVKQSLYTVPNHDTKLNLLVHLLEDLETFKRVIVFVKTRRSANSVYERLKPFSDGKIRVLHANKDQNTRSRAINDFKAGHIRLLVSTDVAARGIDITEVSHVINFDLPILYEEYVHRIGRTGRAKKAGIAITFANPAEMYHIPRVEQLINMKIPVLLLPKEVEITETPPDENQEMLRYIDFQKRKADPTFQGAFHEKQKKKKKKKKRNPRKKK